MVFEERGILVRKTAICFVLSMASFLLNSALASVSPPQSETTGAVLGTVSDPSGAAIVDATVVLPITTLVT